MEGDADLLWSRFRYGYKFAQPPTPTPITAEFGPTAPPLTHTHTLIH